MIPRAERSQGDLHGCAFLISSGNDAIGTEIEIQSSLDEDVFEDFDDLQSQDILPNIISHFEDQSLITP